MYVKLNFYFVLAKYSIYLVEMHKKMSEKMTNMPYCKVC